MKLRISIRAVYINIFAHNLDFTVHSEMMDKYPSCFIITHMYSEAKIQSRKTTCSRRKSLLATRAYRDTELMSEDGECEHQFNSYLVF